MKYLYFQNISLLLLSANVGCVFANQGEARGDGDLGSNGSAGWKALHATESFHGDDEKVRSTRVLIIVRNILMYVPF